MSDIVKDVGFKIREIREERGLTQEKLAGLADLHRAYIGQIERGEKNIGLKNLERIARALGVRIQDVLP
ncbi:MAG: helix-turn-helix transcriptional regulator [Phycisphaerae bacterium]|nr:helix-turn-helix transcriptional regulator [Phycisphaerae bacterium]